MQIVCPAKDFSGFINAFSTDESLQRKFTNFPLKWVVLVDPASDQGPEFSTKYLTRNQIEFPIFPDRKKVEGYGLVHRLDKNSNLFSVIEVSNGEKNLGHHVEYKFNYHEDCWFLVEIVDQST